MKKQLLLLPSELKNDIFRFLPIKKSILLITISHDIYLLNKEFIKKIWEKNKPLTIKEWTNLLTKMKKYCKEGKILKDVINLIEINEKMYGIRLFSESKNL
uniref:F-box domain-containing protein n=1 Tax=Meloidogyne hapla TaxID=6305 RepID=A0A1I8BAS7_MELHA